MVKPAYAHVNAHVRKLTTIRCNVTHQVYNYKVQSKAYRYQIETIDMGNQ